MTRNKITRLLWTLIKDAVLVYAGLTVILFSLQRRLIFPASRAISQMPDSKPYNLAYEDVTLPVRDHVTNAWFVPASGARLAVLCSRGNGGTLSDWLDMIYLFHELGVDVLFYDYGGYGKSTGKPSEQRCYEDALAAWRYLTESRKIAPNRIVLVGHSIGGGVTAQLATEVHPAGVILESTFTSLAQVCQEHLPFMWVKPFVRYRFNNAAKVPQIHCPILIVHSRDDTMVRFHHGERLFELANEPKRFLEIHGDHNEGIFSSGSLYTNGVKAFFDSLGVQ